MVNVIAILMLALIVGAAAGYVYKAKKRGQKCIGCPHAKKCAAQGNGCACQTK